MLDFRRGIFGISSRIVHRLGREIRIFILVNVGMEIGSQQVESIKVELEYLFTIVVDSVAFFVRQTAEIQSKIILFLFEIMTTIFTGLGADVSFAEIVRQFAMGIGLARHEGVHRV